MSKARDATGRDAALQEALLGNSTLTSYISLPFPHLFVPKYLVSAQSYWNDMLRVTGVRLAESISKHPLNLREASAALLPPLP